MVEPIDPRCARVRRLPQKEKDMQEPNQNCYCDIEPMKDTTETLKRLAREAGKNVNAIDGLTERESGLLMCVLAIREFGNVLRQSMDENGQIFAGFRDEFVNLIPGDEPWQCVDDVGRGLPHSR